MKASLETQKRLLSSKISVSLILDDEELPLGASEVDPELTQEVYTNSHNELTLVGTYVDNRFGLVYVKYKGTRAQLARFDTSMGSPITNDLLRGIRDKSHNNFKLSDYLPENKNVESDAISLNCLHTHDTAPQHNEEKDTVSDESSRLHKLFGFLSLKKDSGSIEREHKSIGIDSLSKSESEEPLNKGDSYIAVTKQNGDIRITEQSSDVHITKQDGEVLVTDNCEYDDDKTVDSPSNDRQQQSHEDNPVTPSDIGLKEEEEDLPNIEDIVTPIGGLLDQIEEEIPEPEVDEQVTVIKHPNIYTAYESTLQSKFIFSDFGGQLTLVRESKMKNKFGPIGEEIWYLEEDGERLDTLSDIYNLIINGMFGVNIDDGYISFVLYPHLKLELGYMFKHDLYSDTILNKLIIFTVYLYDKYNDSSEIRMTPEELIEIYPGVSNMFEGKHTHEDIIETSADILANAIELNKENNK